MSKLIESLKASAREFSKKDSPESESVEKKKTDYELTQEQLADIYFSGSEKLKRSDQPLVIKVIEKQHPVSVLPWIITSVAFLITAFSLFSTKRIFVDIKVIDEHSPYPSSAQNSPGALPDRNVKEAGLADKSEFVFGDKLPMQNFVFEGASKLQSSKDKTSLTLINSSVAPFARASLSFALPMNLMGSKIIFYAKGARGGESVALALKDKENIAAFNKGKLFPFPNGLTTDWQKAEVPLLSSDAKFDQRNVTSLRFEIGSKDTENKPGDTVFVRDLQVVPL